MRTRTRLAALAPLVALLAACSSMPASHSPTSSASPPRTTSSAPPATTLAPKPSTGADLKAALLTDMPAGFKINPSGTTNTGTSLQEEMNGSMASVSHCADLDATSWIQVSGMSGVAFAQSDYLDGRDEEIAQEVDSFDSPEHAGRALSQLTAFMETCKTFRDSNSTRFQLAVESAAGLGKGAIKGVMTSPTIEGGVIEVAAVSGNNVITVLYSARNLTSAQRASEIAAQIRTNLRA